LPDTALLNILTGAGVAGVFCVLFICGLIYPRSVITDKDAEIAELKAALAAERDRANTVVAAATTTRDILPATQLGQHAATQPPDPGQGP